MTPIDKIRELNAKRTKGPWHSFTKVNPSVHREQNGVRYCTPEHCICRVMTNKYEDSEFIAELANAAYDILAVIDAANEVVRKYKLEREDAPAIGVLQLEMALNRLTEG